MWRLIPLLAVLCFLEILVPWPDVAALVLSDTLQPEVGVAPHPMAALERRHERSQLLVQLREDAGE